MCLVCVVPPHSNNIAPLNVRLRASAAIFNKVIHLGPKPTNTKQGRRRRKVPNLVILSLVPAQLYTRGTETAERSFRN